MKTIEQLYALSLEIVKFLKEEGINKQGWEYYQNSAEKYIFRSYFDIDATALIIAEYPNEIKFSHYSGKVELNYDTTEKQLKESFAKLQSDFNEFKAQNIEQIRKEYESRRIAKIEKLKSELSQLEGGVK